MQAPALEAAHARNQQVVAELRKLREIPGDMMDFMPDLANYYPKAIAHLQAVYQRLMVAADTVELLLAEGVREVTLRSRSEALTWQLDAAPGQEVAGALLEHLRDQLGEVEQKILEAKARLAGELTGGTAEEWHHANVHSLALLLEAVPQVA